MQSLACVEQSQESLETAESDGSDRVGEKRPQSGHKGSQHCRLTGSSHQLWLWLWLLLVVVMGGEKGGVMREEGAEELHDTSCGGREVI